MVVLKQIFKIGAALKSQTVVDLLLVRFAPVQDLLLLSEKTVKKKFAVHLGDLRVDGFVNSSVVVQSDLISTSRC